MMCEYASKGQQPADKRRLLAAAVRNPDKYATSLDAPTANKPRGHTSALPSHDVLPKKQTQGEEAETNQAKVFQDLSPEEQVKKALQTAKLLLQKQLRAEQLSAVSKALTEGQLDPRVLIAEMLQAQVAQRIPEFARQLLQQLNIQG